MQDLDQTESEIEGFYEHRGVENYNPTAGFVKRIYMILSLHLTTVIGLGFLMRLYIWPGSMDDLTSILLVAMLQVCGVFCMVGSIVVMYMYPKWARNSTSRIVLLFFVRTVCLSMFTSFIGFLVETNFFTYGLCLSISLQITLMCNAALMKEGFNFKNAMLWLTIWSLVATLGLIYGFNLSAIETLLLVIFNFCYGIYFANESRIILKEKLYSLSYHEHMFGALLFQCDLINAFTPLGEKIDSFFERY